MDVGVFTLLFVTIFALAIGATVFWVIYLVEVVKTPEAQWKAAGENQVLHLVLMLVLGIIGTIIYVVSARPKLQQVGPPPPGYGYQPPGYGYPPPPSYPPTQTPPPGG